MSFEPLPIRDRFDGSTRWACPCQDVRGQSAVLEPVRNYPDETARLGESRVENYACDQNGDRWQRIVEADGAARWHYLGRGVGALP